MSEETPEDLIRYDVLTQEALRSVIKKVLDEVAITGLPGEHHFFITFDTTFPGVRLSKRMRERYPEVMTIVIQHSFWNLQTTDTEFELDLSFNDVRERLRVPFAALQAFFDPSVKFGLQFDLAEALGTDAEIIDLDVDQDHEIDSATKKDTSPGSAEIEPMTKTKKSKKPKKSAAKNVDAATDESSQNSSKEEKTEPSADVVSLDAFRKK